MIENYIVKNKNMKLLNTMRIESIVEYYIKPENIEQLKDAIIFAKKKGIKFFLLGNGSNIIFGNDKIKNILVIDLKGMNRILKIDNNLIFECGVLIKDALKYCIQNELSGLEFLAGIPGTIGGIVKMNAGAFGKTVADIIQDIWVYDIDKNVEKKIEDIKFSYRKTYGLENKIVTKVNFKLINSDRESIKREIKEILKKRREKQPKGFSAGSIFKNPAGNFAGRLIEDAGLKGLSISDAEVSLKHGNFIINRKNATASDVVKLIEIIKDKVFQKFGVKLEEEVVIVK